VREISRQIVIEKQSLRQEEEKVRQSELMIELLESKYFVLGMIIFTSIVLMAVLAPFISPYDPIEQNMRETLQPPSSKHLFGTDPFGRDVLSRIIWGSRISLVVGILSVFFAALCGVPLGVIAGYFKGKVDLILSRLIDVMLSFPGIILAIVIMAVLGQSLNNVILAVSISMIPRFARIARGQTLAVREKEFIQAAVSLGASHLTIIWNHILPNILTPLIVQSTLSLGSAIIIEASLSFLGLGVQPPTPTWGEMLNTGRQYLYTAPWIAYSAGFFITLTVLGFNLLGDGLRDVLDPKMRRI